MAQITLPFGNGELVVTIEDKVLGEVVSPRAVQAVPDLAAAIEQALEQPIGTRRLEEIVNPRQRVAIVIDDITRETPTARILPHILARILRARVARSNIRIVIALGTHRVLTDDEVRFKVGEDIAREFGIVNVSCRDETQMVYRGVSANGIPARVNRAVAEADVRIGIGSILPHTDAGFGGGAKIILPGVCSEKTVDAFHARCAAFTTNQLGIVESAIRRDLEEFVADRVGLDFIFNVILTREGDVYQCVAGHYREAHRAGVRFAQHVYGARVAKQYPLVIANAHPFEIDLWQSSKGLWAGEPMVRNGGTLLLVTPCPEGIGVHPRFADYMRQGPDALQAELDEGRAEDPNASAGAIQIGRMKRRIRFGVISPGLSRHDAARMDFLYYDSIADAIRSTLPDTAEAGAVGLLTHGGFTIPLVRDAGRNK